MEQSILKSTKKTLGLADDYDAFDEDVITHINAVFFSLHQLGIGQDNGFMIEDDTTEWEEFLIPSVDLNAIKTYVYLRVRLLFDPPTTSFAIDAMDRQIKELEWRLNTSREYATGGQLPDGAGEYVLDGGPAEGWD